MNKCGYCGKGTTNIKYCNACIQKMKLIRKLQSGLKPYKEAKDKECKK